ncbi:RDD family protein [Haloplanus sp. GCM10025708]|uniref:RDD family protein n=1 Tax=Haloferacaceae TaxID=1644056 RepID=UPI0036211D99
MERPDPRLGTQGDVVGARIVAVVVDLLLLAIVSGLITAPLTAISPRVGAPVGSVISTVVAFAYFTFLEGTYGQTLGKKILNLVVAGSDGSDCGLGEAAIRNLLRYLDWLPAFYLVGVVVVYLTEDRQRLGDVAADTVVVRAAESGGGDASTGDAEPDAENGGASERDGAERGSAEP